MNIKEVTHLSASSVYDYMDCGYMYKLSRIDRVTPDMRIDAFEFGSAIHSALNDFYKEKRNGNKPQIEFLLNSFESHWRDAAEGKTDIRYKDGKDFETLLKEGKELLTVYYRDLPEDNFKVLALEEPFTFTIDGLDIPMVGIIDLIEEDESGNIIITDFKTSSKAYTFEDVAKDIQLTIYHMGVRANGYSDREILLKFDVLIKTKVPKFEQYWTVRNESDERRAINKVRQVWEGINKGVFIQNTDTWKCKGCLYKTHCDENTGG